MRIVAADVITLFVSFAFRHSNRTWRKFDIARHIKTLHSHNPTHPFRPKLLEQKSSTQISTSIMDSYSFENGGADGWDSGTQFSPYHFANGAQGKFYQLISYESH